MSYKHLTPEERGKIEAYLDERLSQAEIARRLDRNRSTISREIKRGSEQRGRNSIARLRYQATSAQNIARMRKRNCGTKTKATIHNTRTILKYLNMKYSPEQIVNAVRSVKVCRATIYNWIYSKVINTDMMLAIKRLIELYPQGVKSITCDRGTEFVNQFNIGTLEDTFGCKIYYANPYAPYERGSNENHNGLLREYFPKPFNFKNVSQRKIDEAVFSMNTRPRKVLGWKTPEHKFKLEYAKVT